LDVARCNRLLAVQSGENGMNMLRNSGANNQVNLQGRNFLEKLLVHQLVKKFPAFDRGS
jgi:hypothetical protein